MSEDFLQFKNEDIKIAFEKYLKKIQNYEDSIQRLEILLNTYMEELAHAKKRNEFMDETTAVALHHECTELLALCKGSLPTSKIPYVLAAIEYFMAHADANPDFSSLDGFEDDKTVIEFIKKEIINNPSPEKKGA